MLDLAPAFFDPCHSFEKPSLKVGPGSPVKVEAQVGSCIYVGSLESPVGATPKMVVSPTNPWVFLLKMIILGCLGGTTI